MNPFKPGDQAYILDKKVEIIDSYSYYCFLNIGWCPISVLSFTPYTAEGITHERPQLKPAGMFWDDEANYQYGVKCNFLGNHYDEKGTAWLNFQEMTFDEYRKLKGL